MYSVCRNIFPPTGVDHCITCNFFGNDKDTLIVASTSLLRIFEVYNSNKEKPKLIQKCEYQLHGNIQCMDKVTLSSTTSKQDTVILSFNDAKLSFVEYDHEFNNLKTISMHQFEDDAIKGGVINNQSRPIIRVDPDGRCSVLLAYGTHLAVIPFLQQSLLDDENILKGNVQQSILPSYVISLSSLSDSVGTVKDICFLEGYNNPMLLLLCEPMPTWAGRISLRQDSFCVFGLSLNTINKDHTIIWRVLHLPFDLTSFISVPKPLGGVLLFGANSLIYLNQSSPPYGVSLNSISNISAQFPLKPTNLSITMDGCVSVFINKETAIVVLRNGDIYSITIVPDNSMRSIKSLSIVKCISSVLPSCVTVINSQYLFIGSRLGNSLLLQYSEGDTLHDGSTQQSYKLEVCDSLVCIGPVVDMCVGESLIISEEFLQKTESNLELVLCTGHGKCGSLSILQRSVKPQIVTTFELPGCLNMWTVLSEDTNEHGFLLLSRQDSTMVLQTNQEITELDNSGFATHYPTVFAGNLGKYVIQATSTDVRLLEGTIQKCYIPLDMRGGVKSCDICGSYVIVLLSEGVIGLLQLTSNNDIPKLDLSWAQLSTGSKVTHVTSYTDYNNVLLTTDSTFEQTSTKRMHLNEEELYNNESDILPTHWVLLTRENGILEIYQLPSFNLAFSARNFTSCPNILCDSVFNAEGSGPISDETVDDLLIVGMGKTSVHPFIIAVINKELIIYESYPYQIEANRLNLRFSKVNHSVILSDRRELKLAKHYNHSVTSLQTPIKLTQFNDIGGYTGVFVSGLYPHWIIMSHKTSLHIHSMYIDGPVTCFAPFNNINCHNGFLYFNSNDDLRISLLPNHLIYDSYWPIRKVPINATPHFVGYHSESKTHVVVSSIDKVLTEVPQLGPDDIDIMEPVNNDDRFIIGTDSIFQVQLYSPISWVGIPTTIVSMDVLQHVTAMKIMSLRSQETLNGRKEFIVISTITTHGEDLNSKGNLQIYDVIEVIPEPGEPLTKYRLKNLYNQEQKWPVTGLDCVNGLILTSMGQKIFMWQFKDKKDLLAVAFIDAETYIHSVKSLRGLILTSDINRSVQLLQYQESRRSLSLISEDMYPMEVFSSDFLVDGNQVGFVVSDSDENIVLLQYQPENPISNGGTFLTRRGDFNIGSIVNSFVRIRCKSSAPLASSNEIKIALMDKRQCLFYGTLDGGLGCVVSIPEKVYRRMSMLQIKLTQGVRHLAGLNPKLYRSYQSKHNILYSAQRNIIDGNLIWSYLQLSSKEKTDFAKQIGTSPGQIIEDLKEIEKVTSHF